MIELQRLREVAQMAREEGQTDLSVVAFAASQAVEAYIRRTEVRLARIEAHVDAWHCDGHSVESDEEG